MILRTASFTRRASRINQTELIATLRESRAEDARAIMRSHMETAEAMMQSQEAQVLHRFMAE